MITKAITSYLNVLVRKDTDGFDHDFYRANYPDLRGFKRRKALLWHYEFHGKAEGRFASLDAARRHFRKLYGAPPSGFDVNVYRQLNPDLNDHYSELPQFEMHFLEYGRFENRPFTFGVDEPGSKWQIVFNLYEFSLLNEAWLPSTTLSRTEALALFESEGIEKIAPIAKDWIFDPTFYAGHFQITGKSDAELYREWLLNGFAAGRAPNERQHLLAFMGGQAYPNCFDWQRFNALLGFSSVNKYSAKTEALTRLFETPIDKTHRACISGEDAPRLYEAMGDYLLIRGRYNQATSAFRKACESSRPIAKSFLRLGDALRGEGKSSEALAAYRSALKFEPCSIWALIHSGNLMMKARMYKDALALVQGSSKRFFSEEHFEKFADELSETAFRELSANMHNLLLNDGSAEDLRAMAEPRLRQIGEFIRESKMCGAPVALPQERRIVILACLDLPQCTFYRVDQKVRLLEDRNVEVEVFDFNFPAKFMNALPGAMAAIFYRVPSYPKIVEAITYARFLRVPTYYDIDDLVFTSDFPDTYESYEGQISRQDYLGLCHGVPLYQQAIRLCESGMASTRSLSDKLAEIVGEGRGRVSVLPNGLDDRSAVAQRFALASPNADRPLNIFYGSGTKAHNQDFNDLLAPALLHILEKYSWCRLVIVGFIVMDSRFEAFEDQIVRYPFIGDLNKYWSVLASCHINVSVLKAGIIADCKSEIKWLEAAMLGIPTVVSRTATYDTILVEGVNGLIASTSAEWLRKLEVLIEDAGLRHKIGAEARELAMKSYSAGALADILETRLQTPQEKLPASNGSVQPRKIRLLICNVFFAPQSKGGATRVVESNIDYFLDHYASAFEISILSSWGAIPAGEMRVDSYRDCPVYRIGSAAEQNMDWKPFDEVMVPAYLRILEIAQPDLIHFHCIQRLTASIVEETLKKEIPYVVTVHDAWWISDHQFLVDQFDRPSPVGELFETILPDKVSRTESIERYQRLRSLLNSACRTLAVSESFADIYRRAGIRNVETCSNGLSVLPKAEASKTTPPDRLILGHLGGRSAHKGATLLEVVLKTSKLPNLGLIMIDGALEPGSQQQELWGESEIAIRPPVKQAEIAALYGAIDVLVAPSIWPESYGLVAREAAFYGTWVIASDTGAMGADVRDGENGFLIDTTSTMHLRSVLEKMDRDIARYKTPPKPQDNFRMASDQAVELAAVYRRYAREEISSRPALQRKVH